jgi:hypothetical protein
MRALFCPFRTLWAWDTDAGFLQGWEKIITSHGASPDITWNSSRFLCVSRRGFPVRVIDRQVHHGGFEDGMDLAIPPIRIRSMISLNYAESQSIPLVVGLHFSSTSYIMPCRFANIKQVIENCTQHYHASLVCLMDFNQPRNTKVSTLEGTLGQVTVQFSLQCDIRFGYISLPHKSATGKTIYPDQGPGSSNRNGSPSFASQSCHLISSESKV